MKILSKICLLFLSSVLIFTSCQKENIDVIIPEDPGFTPDTISVNPFISQFRTQSPNYLSIECLAIPYPIEFLRASGNTVTVNSSQELDIESMQPDSLVDFVYPFSVFANSTEYTITNIKDLSEVIMSCFVEEYECGNIEPHVLLFFNALNIFTLNRYEYKINYPVTLVIQGNSVVIDNDSQYLPAIGGNPSSLPKVELVYPITITQFGRTIVLNNDQDVCEFYETLNEPCQNKPAHIQFFFNEGSGTPINCTYFINYPVTVSLSGTNIVVQSREAYRELLNSSSNAYNNIQLVYPVTAWRFRNNQQLTFGSGGEICQYLNNCR